MERIFSYGNRNTSFMRRHRKHCLMEVNVSEAVQTNILGTKIVADLAMKYNARKFVMVSTDKAVNPSNVMGCSKRICKVISIAREINRGAPENTGLLLPDLGTCWALMAR